MIRIVSLLALGSAALFAQSAKDGWVNLFNGRNLDGWVQKGGTAKYAVVDGQLVGTSVPNTGNSFLCTTRNFTNFILEVEFKDDPGLNSGIQIRSAVSDAPTTEEWYGKEIKVPAGRVHGPQVEIDPSARAWTAGLYGEAIVGWLNDLKENEPARKAFKQGEWNQIRIEVNGLSIKTWLNGVAAVDHKADKVRSGLIALQVHGVGKKEEAMQIRFRSVRLKELP
jgi:hypothetical protein